MALKELKVKLRQEKDSVVTVYRGDIMTVHVPTVPEAKRVCWEFATDGYDIGFGVYFDWSPVTSRAITVHISESSDDEDEDDELEGEKKLLVLFNDCFQAQCIQIQYKCIYFSYLHHNIAIQIEKGQYQIMHLEQKYIFVCVNLRSKCRLLFSNYRYGSVSKLQRAQLPV